MSDEHSPHELGHDVASAPETDYELDRYAQSNLVPFLHRITIFALQFTPFALAKRIRERFKHRIRERSRVRFVDRWVVWWLVGAAFAYLAVSAIPAAIWWRDISVVVAIVGATRVYELILYTVEVVFFAGENPADSHVVASFRRTAILSFVNSAEIVIWFAVFYSVLNQFGGVKVPEPVGLVLIHDSVAAMVANSGSMTMLSPFAWFVSITHKALGLFMTLIVVSRVVSLLPRPISRAPSETESIH